MDALLMALENQLSVEQQSPVLFVFAWLVYLLFSVLNFDFYICYLPRRFIFSPCFTSTSEPFNCLYATIEKRSFGFSAKYEEANFVWFYGECNFTSTHTHMHVTHTHIHSTVVDTTHTHTDSRLKFYWMKQFAFPQPKRLDYNIIYDIRRQKANPTNGTERLASSIVPSFLCEN